MRIEGVLQQYPAKIKVLLQLEPTVFPPSLRNISPSTTNLSIPTGEDWHCQQDRYEIYKV